MLWRLFWTYFTVILMHKDLIPSGKPLTSGELWPHRYSYSTCRFNGGQSSLIQVKSSVRAPWLSQTRSGDGLHGHDRGFLAEKNCRFYLWLFKQILSLEPATILEKGPGDNQYFRGDLHPHLCLDPLLPWTALNQFREVFDKISVPVSGDNRWLIEGISKRGFALFR